MSEAPHTADLGTRYRYRQEGAEAERQRIIRLLIDKAIQSRLDLCDDEADVFDFAVALIKAEQK